MSDPEDVNPAEGEDSEDEDLDQLLETPNPTDVESRLQRHREQRTSRDPEELGRKIEEILQDYPDQDVGRTRQDLENLLRDLGESLGEE